MKSKNFLYAGLATAAALTVALPLFSQTPVAQNRIPQQIVVNGQQVNGTYVSVPGGGMQSFTCENPQQYTTPDGASQGWACYEQSTGGWLLNSLPPAQPTTTRAPATVYQQPEIFYQQPAVIYPQAAVIYQHPATVFYQSVPRVLYSARSRPVFVRPLYPSSVIRGTAAINAAGRIVPAAVGPWHGRAHYDHRGRGGRR